MFIRIIKKFIYIQLVIIVLLSFLLPSVAVNARDLSDAWDITDDVAGGAGYDTSAHEIQPLIGTVITALLSFLGVIFIVLLVYGGYLWMTDRGNEEQVKRAKNLITAAVIGLVIIVLAYAISLFVLEKITSGVLKDTVSTEETE